MPRSRIVRSTEIARTARVMQLEGLFDIAPQATTSKAWDVHLPIEQKPWSVGLIVGPSGCGKTTIAREFFGDALMGDFEWSQDGATIDSFPKALGIREITDTLCAVGFSSPPSWLKPFRVLSNGEQFRVNIARALCESRGMVVVDEFTSVVDRTVAQFGACAIANAVRKTGRQFIGVSCHYDIVEWLQPDWIYQPHLDTFEWRCLRRRPDIAITVRRCDSRAWRLFAEHHYMTSALNAAAGLFVAFIDDETPIACVAVLPMPHAVRSGWRLHRLVVLPDYQGVGIGMKLADIVAGIYAGTGKPVFRTASHPAVVAYGAKAATWTMTRTSGHTPTPGKTSRVRYRNATGRLTASFRYTGPANADAARSFGLLMGRE